MLLTVAPQAQRQADQTADMYEAPAAVSFSRRQQALYTAANPSLEILAMKPETSLIGMLTHTIIASMLPALVMPIGAGSAWPETHTGVARRLLPARA